MVSGFRQIKCFRPFSEAFYSTYYKQKHRSYFLSLALFVILFVVFSICSCGDRKEKDKKGVGMEKPSLPVTVTIVEEKHVPVEIEGTGHVKSGHSVDVRPRVSGQLDSVHFKEGQNVSKGDLLFSIDPAPFKARVDQALADLEKDRARRRLAADLVNRYRDISDKGYLSTEEYDKLKSDLSVLDASIKSGEAALKTAQLDLSYCSIHAEISGVTGVISVDPGNQISQGDSMPLTTIRRVTDLDVAFSVPEKYMNDIRIAMNKGSVPVIAENDSDFSTVARGNLTFIDNSIDAATGTVALKAKFDNGEKTLWPGQFVRVVAGLKMAEKGPVVPSRAVQTGQNGLYVYVVNKDNTVSMRSIKTGLSVNDETLVTEGLVNGDTVVVEGQLKLYDGAPVKKAEKVEFP